MLGRRPFALALCCMVLAALSSFTLPACAQSGCIAARVLVEALRRAGPTAEKLTQALEGLRNFNLGGFEVGFAPGAPLTRQRWPGGRSR
ncbi:hypothetical protein [Thauera sinica]|uniref:Uncharacterized protein n=1 Tax=Thauera sinica TaxID=2665146 RepID=A0ABW1AWF3_9RHOO|nr:hypothetical protein [Thauera sp. K11]ATE61820.1 hypothetical protein CCZ27_19275 [Thauera sp. K11]